MESWGRALYGLLHVVLNRSGGPQSNLYIDTQSVDTFVARVLGLAYSELLGRPEESNSVNVALVCRFIMFMYRFLAGRARDSLGRAT